MRLEPPGFTLWALLFLAVLALAVAGSREPDVVVVGAGCGGLATAYEASRAGAEVTVVDLASVFGGHAVVSEGGLSFPGTPLQASLGVRDSPDQMYEDMVRMGGDADEGWVRLYVDRSIPEVYDWLVSLGVRFDALDRITGNTVARFHKNPQRGFGVVEPVYRACLRSGRVTFVWNTRVTRLLVEQGRVVGVEGRNERTGERLELRGDSVVLATGGFQSNLDLVRRYWPADLPVPPRLMVGSGVNSTGSGLELAAQAGGASRRLDHQWNYPRGIPDPRYPGTDRGLSLNNVRYPWVNQGGRRFVKERGSDTVLRALLEQPGSRAFLVFDEEGKADFNVAGTDWADRAKIERLILGNPEITLRASGLADLATKAGLPVAELQLTIDRWNQLVLDGEDLDFGRFSRKAGTFEGPGLYSPRSVRRAPFYAVAVYPITRKSMGGLVIDRQCRVLSTVGEPIPGLYAVGEVTGFGGINGKASIEGTFIAPSMLQGRLVGRALAASRRQRPSAPSAPELPRPRDVSGQGKGIACSTCHALEKLTASSRPGYWHFERVHRRVLQDELGCVTCHAEMTPFQPGRHTIDREAQIAACAYCHLARRAE